MSVSLNCQDPGLCGPALTPSELWIMKVRHGKSVFLARLSRCQETVKSVQTNIIYWHFTTTENKYNNYVNIFSESEIFFERVKIFSQNPLLYFTVFLLPRIYWQWQLMQLEDKVKWYYSPAPSIYNTGRCITSCNPHLHLYMHSIKLPPHISQYGQQLVM